MANKRKYRKCVLWIMGPTASGKTTVGREVAKILLEKGIPVIHYDGDEVRKFFGPNFGFAKEDRLRVVKTLSHLANKALESELNVVVSALTANDDARSYIMANVQNMILIYLDCSLDKCIERDYKGLYKKAMNGEIQTLAGVNTPYQPLVNPDIVINTEKMTVENSAIELVDHLRKYVDFDHK